MNRNNIFSAYPDCVEDRNKLRIVLLDFFPGEKLKHNLILAAYDLGIVTIIKHSANLDETMQLSLWKSMIEEYGIKEEHAAWAISYWMTNYGSYLLRKTYSFVEFPNDNERIVYVASGDCKENHTTELEAELEKVNAELVASKEAADTARIEAENAKAEVLRLKQELASISKKTLSIDPNNDNAESNESALIAKSFKYATNDSEVLIKKYIGKGGEVRIPDFIDGLPVTGIADWAFGGRGGKRIHKIHLPQHLRYIGTGAFQALEITGVLVLPRSVVDVGNLAFEGTRLSGLVIQSDCNLDLNSFGAMDELEFIYVHKGCRVRIDSSTFYLSEALTDIVLPKEVTYIGEENFENCSEAVMYAPEGSRATKYAKKNYIDVNSEQYEAKCMYYERLYPLK